MDQELYKYKMKAYKIEKNPQILIMLMNSKVTYLKTPEDT